MFKKLKDKLAEEVKSSPQRIQQFAQAAQAAVTSASSSISDITNSDLFSIGDNDGQPGQLIKSSPSDQKNTFQDVSLVQPRSVQPNTETEDNTPSQDINENQRQRKLSNCSFASDVSFRLPSYESPSMYHLQSDIEISASEAEERGFSSGAVSLDRVTKEQIYAAYRRTQDRYTKYRTQYADLARHYKLLERENAKAKSVLVETQDKTLRRISELKEQCTLEQSAKAHLEKALRFEIEEKNIKIETLNTKIHLLQGNNQETDGNDTKGSNAVDTENNVQLISFDNEKNQTTGESLEITALNSKIEKLEKLVNKYKESLKSTKEKNAQLTTEIQMLSNESDTKNKEIEQLKVITDEFNATKQRVQELNELNEQLQNKINTFDFNKSKELSTLEIDLQKSREEIAQLQKKIEVFSKREEEYAISLAENKLSIHKELEDKESEIKSLKDRLSVSKQEIQSLNIVINDYKTNISHLEDECSKHKYDASDINSTRAKISDLESQLQSLSQKCHMLEIAKSKSDEEYKCLQLQLKQETAEKLAMIDRNVYLEERIAQLSEENTKKSLQISMLDSELQILTKDVHNIEKNSSEKQKMEEDIDMWKNKYSLLESEIQEERVELVKLQSVIEKLLANHELIQLNNTELNLQLDTLKLENNRLLQSHLITVNTKPAYEKLIHHIKDLQNTISLTSQEAKSLKDNNNHEITKLKRHINHLLSNLIHSDDIETLKIAYEEQKKELKQITEEYHTITAELYSLRDERNKLQSEISNNELKRSDVEEKIRQTNEEHERALRDQERLTEENKAIKEKFGESQVKQQQQYEFMTIELNSSKGEINSLKLEISDNELKRHEIENDLRRTTDECKQAFNELETIKNENKILGAKLNESQAKCVQLEKSLNDNNSQKLVLKQEISDMAERIKKIEHESALLNKEISESKRGKEDNFRQIKTLKEENSLLMGKLHDNADKQVVVEKLQHNIKDLTQENIYLKTQSEGIANNVKELEIELREVRQSHADIEIEKDHLNLVIEQLDRSEREKNLANKDTQTIIEGSTETTEELRVVQEISSTRGIFENTENTDAYHLLVNENDLLKEENKRLQSDVTGLQTYLAKISKENSELNDKLRELIATSENQSDKNEIDKTLMELKDKLDDLIRENTLLGEENLELKDQLSSQNYVKAISSRNHNTKANDLNIQEKYNNLQDTNIKLEKKMLDLESINKSVNGNMMQVQESNEKLRLTNEKLERRLDEALVSLRHLHSLQENTELEYLRNILYEYLTGTGAHSETLAKVLAAVVKFDDTQTQIILQKEKERQGFLRQLGLL